MSRLRLVIWLQLFFAALSLGYLILSGWLLKTTGQALSAVPIMPSILLFIVYIACLQLPRLGWIKAYRGAMLLAILLFGGGGVIGNVSVALSGGMDKYASLMAFLIAVAINSYGTVLNVIALLGLCRVYQQSSDEAV